MWKQFIAAFICATALLSGSGALFRSQLDAISRASAHGSHFSKDKLHGIYVLGVGSRFSLFHDDNSMAMLKSAFLGASPKFSCHSPVSLAFPSGDVPLAQFVERVVIHLRECGLDVSPYECSPVMLRSKALVGKLDILIAPSRVILKSDVPRLGLIQLSAEELGGWCL